MIHIRIDHSEFNVEAKFMCGIGWPLPPGDKYFWESEVLRTDHADCPGCNPDGPRPLGTPLSELSGRPGHPGYEEFCRIAESWGNP